MNIAQTEDICDVLANMVEKWCGWNHRREFADDLWSIVNHEMNRCARVAETGHGAVGHFIADKIREVSKHD